MTHKERFLAAVNHEEPDRVPICAFFTPEIERKLLRYLGADSDQISTYQAVGGPLPVLMGDDFCSPGWGRVRVSALTRARNTRMSRASAPNGSGTRATHSFHTDPEALPVIVIPTARLRMFMESR